MDIIWTFEALEDAKQVYNYYKSKVSIRSANSIKSKIFTSVKNLQKQARKGQVEELLLHKQGEYRYLVTGNYKIIYKLTGKEIYIMKVFDCRQNPVKIKE